MLARLDLPEILTHDVGVVVEGTVTACDEAYHLVRLEIPGGSLQVGHSPLPTGRRLRVQIQSRDVSIALEKPVATSIVNLLPAKIVSIADADDGAGAHVLVLLDAGGTSLMARITRYSRDRLGLAPGAAVWAQIKAAAVVT
jgi:molybdate transport system ATP-binding protein